MALHLQCTVLFEASVCVRFLMSHWRKQATTSKPRVTVVGDIQGHGRGHREASTN